MLRFTDNAEKSIYIISKEAIKGQDYRLVEDDYHYLPSQVQDSLDVYRQVM